MVGLCTGAYTLAEAGPLTGRRVQRARWLLENGDLPLERVARLSGLGTAANLRELVRRHTGLAPSTYRTRFRAGPTSS